MGPGKPPRLFGAGLYHGEASLAQAGKTPARPVHALVATGNKGGKGEMWGLGMLAQRQKD